MYSIVFIKYANQSYTTLTANPNGDIPLNSTFHRASETTSLLVVVHYSISAFCASDWTPGFYFIFCGTFSTDMYHPLLLWGLHILLGVRCCPHIARRNLSTPPNRFPLTAVSCWALTVDELDFSSACLLQPDNSLLLWLRPKCDPSWTLTRKNRATLASLLAV